MVPPSRLLVATLALGMVIAACSNAATPTATPAGGSATPAAGSATPAGGSPSPAASIVATVPDDQLIFPGKLVICSDLPYAPQEYFDEQGNPIGSDIEIGQAIGARLGLQVEIENSVFDTIIPAMTGGKCDIIISAQNITPERLRDVDMIPFFKAGQAFMVQAGNPANINTTEDLCGKKIAVEAGTTMLDYVSGENGYANGGLPKACTDASKDQPQPQPYPKDSDAVAALQSGSVDAYMADLPVVIGYVNESPDKYALADVPQIDPALEGISVGKPADTSLEHTPLYDAVKTAFLSLVNDGTYMTILTKYQVQGGAITADEVNAPLPSPAPAASPT